MPGQYLMLFLTLVTISTYFGTISGKLIDGFMHHEQIESYDYHPCTRPCEDDTLPMVCDYDFLIEHYHTLTKACYDCPTVKEDCFSPHCVYADGYPREIMTVNRRMPGPPIHVCENDTIRVRVHNGLEMSEGVAIHWHGMTMKGTPYMDGVGMITQCAIPTHTSFTYNFVAATPGTHFWHAHSGMQRGDGLFGQLVVRQPPMREAHKHRIDVDMPEHTMIVHDWAKRSMAATFATYYHMDHQKGMPHTLLINGKGSHVMFYDERTGKNVTTPREVFTVRYGVRYRFRVAGANIQSCPIRISVDNHNIELIAADGHPVVDTDFESFTIQGGERYDFILTADQAVDNYLIRFQSFDHCKGVYQTAILRYIGAPNDDTLDTPMPELLGRELNPFNKKQSDTKIQVSELRSLEENDPSLTREVDKRFSLAMDFTQINFARIHNERYYSLQQIQQEKSRVFTPQINKISMIMPDRPPLTQYDEVPQDIYCNKTSMGNRDCYWKTCECLHTLRVDLHDVVEIILVDEGQPRNSSHPFHLHGYSFRVVAMDKVGTSTIGSLIEKMDAAGNITRNLDRAPLKDTIVMPDGGYTIIRFYADNPGMWVFHCHVAYHTEMGMSLVFQVGDKSDFPPVPRGFPRCGSWDGGSSGMETHEEGKSNRDDQDGIVISQKINGFNVKVKAVYEGNNGHRGTMAGVCIVFSVVISLMCGYLL